MNDACTNCGNDDPAYGQTMCLDCLEELDRIAQANRQLRKALEARA